MQKRCGTVVGTERTMFTASVQFFLSLSQQPFPSHPPPKAFFSFKIIPKEKETEQGDRKQKAKGEKII